MNPGLRLSLLACLLLAACSSSPGTPPRPIGISLAADSPKSPAGVRITGLSGAELSALAGVAWPEESWHKLLTVTVADTDAEAIPVAGRYVAAGDALTFYPRYPFDPGRSYTVRFDPARLPTPRPAPIVRAAVALPRHAPTAPTVVTAVSPTGENWPANLLRFYVHFSGPMSQMPGVDFVSLVDDQGKEVPHALLPSPIDLCDGERTRCTIFFEPARVKRGIMDNRMLGRALRPGHRYAIVVGAGWRDAEGRPLAASYRKTFRVGPPIERALALGDWRLYPPRAGTTDALRVTFPTALDEGLLHRAIAVIQSGPAPLAGRISIAPGEREWRFVPARPWQAGPHNLLVSSILEDPAGNRIGEAFEVTKSAWSRERPAPEQRTVPFLVR